MIRTVDEIVPDELPMSSASRHTRDAYKRSRTATIDFDMHHTDIRVIFFGYASELAVAAPASAVKRSARVRHPSGARTIRA